MDGVLGRQQGVETLAEEQTSSCPPNELTVDVIFIVFFVMLETTMYNVSIQTSPRIHTTTNRFTCRRNAYIVT